MFYITWQPETVESGNYLLTLIESEDSNLELNKLMESAHNKENLDMSPYDLCSIIYVRAGTVTIVY